MSLCCCEFNLTSVTLIRHISILSLNVGLRKMWKRIQDAELYPAVGATALAPYPTIRSPPRMWWHGSLSRGSRSGRGPRPDRQPIGRRAERWEARSAGDSVFLERGQVTECAIVSVMNG